MEENDMVGGEALRRHSFFTWISEHWHWEKLHELSRNTLICSFCLVWQLICSGKSSEREKFQHDLGVGISATNFSGNASHWNAPGVIPMLSILKTLKRNWFLKYLYLGKNEVQRLDGMCSYCLIQSTASPWNTLYFSVLSLILLAPRLASRKEVMFVNSGEAVLTCLVLGRGEWDLWVIELIGQAVDCFLLLPHKWGWLYPQKELGQIELENWVVVHKQYVRSNSQLPWNGSPP